MSGIFTIYFRPNFALFRIGNFFIIAKWERATFLTLTILATGSQ